MYEPLEILRILMRHRTDFVIVGGVAARLAGSPVSTADLDLVYLNEESNNRRFAAALAELDALYKDPAGRRIEPDAERLSRNQINLLRTSLGDLDLLQSIGHGRRYDDLLLRSIEYRVDGLTVKAIDVPTLIEAKTVANRPKDHYALLYLQELLLAQRNVDKT